MQRKWLRFFFPSICKLHRYSRVKGRHYRKFASCSLSSPALPGYWSMLQLPHEAASPFQLPGDSLFWRCSGLLRAAEGGTHIHHGKIPIDCFPVIVLTASENAQGYRSLLDWCLSYAGKVHSVKSLTQGHLCPAQSLKGGFKREIMLGTTNIQFCGITTKRFALWKDRLIQLKFAVGLVCISSKKCNRALTWLMSRSKLQWTSLMLFIQHKGNPKADFKVRHTKRAKIKNVWERCGMLKRSTSLSEA